jgi:hypothetical protein
MVLRLLLSRSCGTFAILGGIQAITKAAGVKNRPSVRIREECCTKHWNYRAPEPFLRNCYIVEK